MGEGWFLARLAWWVRLCSLLRTRKLTSLGWDMSGWNSFCSSRMCEARSSGVGRWSWGDVWWHRRWWECVVLVHV